MNRMILMPLLAGQDFGDGTGLVTHADLDAAMAGFGTYTP